eukprot:scaffold4031_cov129-Skeletonema_marinoi.AAC.3
MMSAVSVMSINNRPRRDYSPYLLKITSLPIETVLEDIRDFKSDASFAITELKQPHQKVYLGKLVEGGIYPIILEHLKRCEDETFADVLGEERVGHDEFIESPLVWVVFLANSLNYLQDRDISIEIAENIDPLFKCIRDDMTRELFGEQKFWYETYPTFLAMVPNLVTKSRETMDILLQKQKLLDMIIQPLFWQMYRPDIMTDQLAVKYFSPHMFTAPMHTLYYIVARICNQINDEGQQTHNIPERLNKDEMKQLSEIGYKAIVSEAYDPKCDITFMAGLLDLIKLHDPTSKQIWYYMLNEMGTSGCVDNRVINRAVCHGSKSTLDHIDATKLPHVLFVLLHKVPPGDKLLPPLPDDARYAVAIDAGLLQMSMDMILRFESLYDNDLYRRFLSIIEGANSIAFHPKTQKAIARVDKAELRRILSKPQLHSLGRRNELCDKIFGTIAFFSKDIAPSQGPKPNFGGVLETVCSSCSKELEKYAIKRCGQCKKRIYCSRECQANDWKNGHKKECKLMLQQDADTDVTGHANSGILGSEKKKLKLQKQTVQVLAAAKEMFIESTPVVLWYANLNDWDILDCVVDINFCVSPPSFEMKAAADFLDNFTKQSIHDNLKRYIEETRADGALTINVMFNPATGQPGDKEATFLNVQINMPGSCMKQGSWPAAQKSMLETMKEDDPDWQGPGHIFAGFAPGKSLMDRWVPPRDAM